MIGQADPLCWACEPWRGLGSAAWESKSLSNDGMVTMVRRPSFLTSIRRSAMSSIKKRAADAERGTGFTRRAAEPLSKWQRLIEFGRRLSIATDRITLRGVCGLAASTGSVDTREQAKHTSRRSRTAVSVSTAPSFGTGGLGPMRRLPVLASMARSGRIAWTPKLYHIYDRARTAACVSAIVCAFCSGTVQKVAQAAISRLRRSNRSERL